MWKDEERIWKMTGLLESLTLSGVLGDQVEVLETHISWVFLTNDLVYKIKKPVDLGFLNYSTLEFRKKCCEREVRLNSRVAPDLYLGVIPIFGEPVQRDDSARGGPKMRLGLEAWEGAEIVEYAVKMRRFHAGCLLDEMAERGELTEDLVVQVVEGMVDFHARAEQTPGAWGPERVGHHVLDCFSQGGDTFEGLMGVDWMRTLKTRVEEELKIRGDRIQSRKSSFVKQLHGDYHLKNICVFEGKVLAFDGIEFNDEYCQIDVWADFAFFLMDLFYRGYEGWVGVALTRYLEVSDDFEGLELLPLYLAYRHLVRAKVGAIRYRQLEEGVERGAVAREIRQHLEWTERHLTQRQAGVLGIGGFPGSGKTTLGREVVRRLGAIQVRTDILRKRQASPENKYTPKGRMEVYQQMMQRISLGRGCGRWMIADATFASEEGRKILEETCRQEGRAWMGVWVKVGLETARARIQQRRGDASEASVSVTEQYFTGGEQKAPTDWLQIDGTEPVEDQAEAVLKGIGCFS